MIDIALLAGLFASAFTSATILPGSSEAMLVALLATERGQPAMLIAVATLGNVAGSAVNYVIGRGVERLRGRRWFPVAPAAYERAVAWFGAYGAWSLLLAWLPVVGDPLTFAAGALRVGWTKFLVLVTAGKLARYTFLALGVLWWNGQN